MNISDIMNIVENYGIKGSAFIIFSFITLSIFKSAWMNNALSKISDKFIEKFMINKTKNINKESVQKIKESDILNHEIFDYIELWLYSNIPTLQFSTEYRTLVFRKYLQIFLKSYKKNFYDFVESKEYQLMDDSELSTSLMKLINKTIYDYERESRLAGIPEIVIEKMKLKNNNTISLIVKLIDTLSSSKFYTSDKNLLKIYSILNLTISVLETTVMSAEQICNSINGQLSGSVYVHNGIKVIEP